MKLILKLGALLLCLMALCGCSEKLPESTADVEKILSGVVESIDWEELEGYAEQGADALMDKFPSLKTLIEKEKMQQMLKDHGLKLLNKYIESTDTGLREKADKLGQILVILNPELSDEVNTVLGK